MPAFLFLGVIISIQVNGEAISLQRVARRGDLAIDFREVHGALAGTGVCNVLAGVAGTVPNIVSPGIVSYTQVTGVASRRVGYCVGGLFIALAFLPKVSGLLSSLPGPVMAGYLILITGTLFVDGDRDRTGPAEVDRCGRFILDRRGFSVRLVQAARPWLGVGNTAQERRNYWRLCRSRDDSFPGTYQPSSHAI